MLRVVTGRFFPDLEQALVAEVRRLKAADPLTPLALIVPSSSLVTYLRRLLVVESGAPLLNVHVLTFYQLALRLQDERTVSTGETETPTAMTVASDLFFEQLLGRMLRHDRAAFDRIGTVRDARGALRSLWSTIRDLNDAAVDPAAAARAVEEGLFGQDDAAWLSILFRLQAAMEAASRAIGVWTPDGLTASITSWASRSMFLKGLTRICYYGFYDLTQVQVSFLEAVVAEAPATLYFPLDRQEAYAFARRFLERQVFALSGAESPSEPERVRDRPGPRSPAAPLRVRIVSAVGAEPELAVACKEILDLVESRGYRFDEIGIVARNLEPYRLLLRRLLDAHRIPFITSVLSPVIEHPLVKTLLLLARLPMAGFAREEVLAVLTSPFFALPARASSGPWPRPEVWRRAAESLGVMGGEAEWARLARTPWERDDEQRGIFTETIERLMQDCRRLPQQGPIGRLTDAFAAAVSRHLRNPADDEPVAGPDDAWLGANQAWTAVEAALDELSRLDVLGLEVTWEEWLRLFVEALERAGAPLASSEPDGVIVLDAMAARGLSVRALFVLGMNEKVFPRVVREDAFLQDRHRRVLAETLGYKIDEKLQGYDEEQLLFALLCHAAKDRLYLLGQRADEEGRVLAASPYRDAWRELVAPVEEEPPLLVPRRLPDAVGTSPFLPDLLTPREWVWYQALEGQDVADFGAAIGQDRDLVRNSLEALRSLEGEQLGPYDGMTGPVESFLDGLPSRGLSPTGLETYAQCPFRYFAGRVLGLEANRPRPEPAPTPPVMGDLCHQVLRNLYPRLVEQGWPEQDLPHPFILELTQAAIRQAWDAFAQRSGPGYALLWRMAQDDLAALVLALLDEDRRNCLDTGFRPVGFEIEAWGEVDKLSPAIQVAGRFDRIDRRGEPPGSRVLDYKYKQGQDLKGTDRKLLEAAVRGNKLQPPLYALMRPAAPAEAAGTAELPERVEFLYLSPAADQVVERASFERRDWEGPAGRQMAQTLGTIIRGIREGRHFIVEGRHCESCAFAAVCRRFHAPTKLRALWSPPAKVLREMRKQKVQDE